MSSSRKDIETSLSSLHISKPPKSKKAPVADSWEEDSDASSPSEETSKHRASSSRTYPDAPPPTPISPTTSYASSNSSNIAERFSDWPTSATSERFPAEARRGSVPERRQEKTDAVAKRMIAGALGVKAPKKTEEQRAYDRAVREGEMKRRNREKEEEARRKEEAERARASVWED